MSSFLVLRFSPAAAEVADVTTQALLLALAGVAFLGTRRGHAATFVATAGPDHGRGRSHASRRGTGLAGHLVRTRTVCGVS